MSDMAPASGLQGNFDGCMRVVRHPPFDTCATIYRNSLFLRRLS